MTLSETKARIRHARLLMRELRASVNACRLSEFPTAIHLPRTDYDVLEWGMGHLLKEWIHEIDSEGEIIPGTAELFRMRGTYMRNDGTENFMFKAIPVRCAEPYGLQR